MSKEKIFSEDEIAQIIKLFSEGKIKNKEIIATKFGTSKRKIREILNHFNIDKTIKKQYPSYNEALNLYTKKLKHNHIYVAICKKTNTKFYDYANISGALTNYLLNNYENLNIPTPYIRRKIFIETGKFWHEEYFLIIQEEKIEKSKIDTAEIIRLYESGELRSTHKLAQKFNVGHKKISAILKENNIKINNKGGQIKYGEVGIIEKRDAMFYEPSDINKILIAKCKKTGIEFKDANNISGVLTRHLIDEYGIDIDIPSNPFRRKVYEFKNTNKWYEKYFDIIEIEKQKTRNCPYCEWETVDITNKTGCFEVHINTIHGISIREHLINHPKDAVLHVNEINRQEHELAIINNDNYVTCHICNERFMAINSIHLAKHNITIEQYKKNYNSEIISKRTLSIMTDNLNKGRLNITNNFISKPQQEIFNFLISNGINCQMNDKKLLNGIEIDIISHDLKLGIEFNGNLWHSERFGKKGMNYHLNKTKLMNNAGYGLIHIFEDEWTDNKELVLDKILSIFGKKKSTTIGARKTKIREISIEIKNDFLNKFHIQKADKGNIRLGAFYHDELVGVMTFNNKKNTSKIIIDNSTWELTRFATNNNYILPGLGSKLLNYFIENYKPKRIISYADRRWTLNKDNNLYTKMKFNLTKIVKPTYYYLNFKETKNKRLYKYSYGKNALKKRYPNLDFNKTEKELMFSLGYDRIWDCGLFKYELNI